MAVYCTFKHGEVDRRFAPASDAGAGAGNGGGGRGAVQAEGGSDSSRTKLLSNIEAVVLPSLLAVFSGVGEDGCGSTGAAGGGAAGGAAVVPHSTVIAAMAVCHAYAVRGRRHPRVEVT